MGKISDIKQDDIIRSAIDVFSQKGFHQASMEGISKHAGVSKRTLYKYFPNKDALFSEIVDTLMCRFNDQQAICFDPGSDLSQQLTRLMKTRMEHVTTDTFQITSRLVISECIRCPDISKVLSERFSKMEECCGLQDWIADGIRAGKLDIPDITIAVEQLMGSIKATVFWPQLIAHQSPVTIETLDLSINMAVNSFLKSYSR